MNNQPPLFTSSSGQAQGGDDFDLGEVFAEYFSNEFDLDPLNAYTSSMANYSGGAAALPTAAAAHATAVAAAAQGASPSIVQNNTAQGGTANAAATAAATAAVATENGKSGSSNASSGVSLPTGGIKTAFHVGTTVPTRPAGVIVPPQKRNRNETTVMQPPAMMTPNPLGGPMAALALAHQQATSAAAQQQNQQQQQLAAAQGNATLQPQQNHLNPQNHINPALVPALPGGAAAAVSGGVSLVAPTAATAAAPAAGMHVGSSSLVAPAVPAAATAATGGVQVPPPPADASVQRAPLPVGVGIRLGGLGGIAPATAQASARPPVLQAQYSAGAMWGGAPGMVPTGANPFAMGMMGATSEVATAERRQRNREHAKRSRVRKKFMLESMQEQVRSLQIENQNLRLLVQEHLPEHAVSIISECCTTSPLFADSVSDGTNSGAMEDDEDESTKLGRSDFSLINSLTTGQKCFVLSDPKLPDNPIVFASPGFYEMTQYTAKQVLGRNCRFLQGPGTDVRAVDIIRKAIATGADATVCLLNYKADGTPFWNQFFMAALRDSDNCIVNYVGVQCEVEPEQGDSAVEDKVNEVLPLANKGDEKADEKEEE